MLLEEEEEEGGREEKEGSWLTFLVLFLSVTCSRFCHSRLVEWLKLNKSLTYEYWPTAATTTGLRKEVEETLLCM